MKEIPLTKGQVAIVEDADYQWLSQFHWQASWSKKSKKWYAVKGEYEYLGKAQYRMRTVGMHRFIMGVTDSRLEVDHENLNTLDNRRANLRVATRSQNQHNRRRQSNNRSGYKGVGWHRASSKWRARIAIGGKQVFLGLFSTPEEAFAAYCKASSELHGEFGRAA